MRYAFVLILISTLAFGQDPLPSFKSEHLQEIWIDQDLKGKPSEFYITEYNYDNDAAELYKSEITKHYFYRNEKLMRIELHKDGDPIKTYSYDEYGRITLQLRTDTFESIPKITYSYDKERLVTTETIYRLSGTVHSKTLLRYNDKHQVIAKEEFQGSDKLIRYWIYNYNNKGDRISEEYYDLMSSVTATANNKPVDPTDVTVYKYDYSEDKVITNRSTYKNDKLISTTKIKDFPDSLVQEKLLFQTNGTPVEKQVIVEFDSARVMVKGFFNTGDTTSYRSRFEEVYVDGDLIEYESRTLRGTFVDRFATFYEYDFVGNWIKKTTYSNGITIKVQERRIRY